MNAAKKTAATPTRDSGTHPALRLVTETPKRVRAVRAAKAPPESTVGLRVAGATLGSAVPLLSAALSHYEITVGDGLTLRNGVCAVLVLGALAFSFPSVYQLLRKSFACPYKAAGMTILLEGTYTTPMHSVPGLLAAVAALGILVAINAVKASSTLATSRAS